MIREKIESFLNLSARNKLAIIADVTTILGISVATLVAGPFLTELVGLGFDLSEFIWAIIFYSVVGVICLSTFFGVLGQFRKDASSNKNERIILSILGVLLLAVVITIFSGLKTAFGDLTDSRYLLPREASYAVKQVIMAQLFSNETLRYIEGEVSFEKEISSEDYVISLYSINSRSGLYELHRIKNYDKYTEFNSSGKFKIPLNETDQLIDPYVVIYRHTDSSFFNSHFPDSLTQMPSKEIDELGAKSIKVTSGD